MDDFRIGETLAHGSTGVVKKLYTNNKIYAVKIIEIDKKSEKDVMKEVKIHKILSHNHIVKFICHEIDLKNHYLVMQLAENELFYFIEPGIGIEGVHFYFRQMMDAVWYLHSLGICHRDIKPENILLDSNGNLLLTDFGHSTLFRVGGKERILHTVVGSCVYMAPEIFKRRYRGDEVDIWSSGVVLFVMSTGLHPWDEPDCSDKRFEAFVKLKYHNYPPWNNLEPSVLKLIEGMCSIQKRFKKFDIENNIWYSQKLKPIKIIKQPTYSFSQPQSYVLSPTKNFISSQTVTTKLHRFYLMETEQQILQRLAHTLDRMVVQYAIKNFEVSFNTVDRKRNILIGEFHIKKLNQMVSVSINRLRGDCLEFKRFCNIVFEKLNSEE